MRLLHELQNNCVIVRLHDCIFDFRYAKIISQSPNFTIIQSLNYFIRYQRCVRPKSEKPI